MPSLEDVQLTITTSQKGDGVKNAKKDLSKFAGEVQQVSDRVGKAFAAIGAVSAGALAVASKSAIDFESSFAGIRKTVDASEEEFSQLSANIREMSKTIPTGVNELNALGEIAGQLGVSGVDNLTKFIRTVADIAETTNMTSEQAATSFARIANVMGIPIDNVDKMASSVVDLGNNFATTESEIVAFAERIAGAGKIAGFSANDIFGIAAAMSSVGIEAEAGGTAVQKVMLTMNEAITQGTEQMELLSAVTGMTVEELKEQWAGEANGVFNAFVNGLQASGDDAIKVLDELELKDQRLVRAFLSLANAGDLVNQAAQTSGQAWRENTALTEEAAKRYETTQAQLEVMKNRFQDIAITIGEAVLPKINALLERLQPIIETFANFVAEHPNIVLAFIAIGLVIGALGGLLLLVINPLLSLITLWGGLSVAVTAAITTALWWVAAIVAAIIGLYVAWQTNFLGIRDIVQGVIDFFMNNILPLIQWFFEVIKIQLQIIKNIFTVVWWAIRQVVEAVVNYLANTVLGKILIGMFNFISNKLAEMGITWDTVWQGIKSTVTSVASDVLSTVQNMVNGIIDKINWVIGKANSVGRKIPGWEEINAVPHLANGVTNFSGGLAVVGERGPELVNLPRGADVMSNKESRSLGQQVTIEEVNINNGTDLTQFTRQLAFAVRTA